MNNPKSNTDFQLMSLGYKLRDFRLPRREILKETGIKKGDSVLDYGCGPGSYIVPTAELIGDSGTVYALDIHPLAIKKVKDVASSRRLKKVKTIQSSCSTGLPDKSIDVVLLYDIFHDLSNPNEILEELHRVLKSKGILSFSDHHLKETEILKAVQTEGLFKLANKGGKTYTFRKDKVKVEPNRS